MSSSPQPDDGAGESKNLLESQAYLRAILDDAVDAIIAIDEQGVIRMANPAAERMFGYSREELIGHKVNKLMPSPDREQHDDYIGRYLRTGEPHIIGIGREVTGRRKDGTFIPVHLAVSEVVVDERRSFIGVLRDIADIKAAIDRQNQLIVELREALEKVKRLSGLLPICASCKKIRDDQGYWKQLEAYISEHSEAEFSHSLCPDCFKRLYPEYYRGGDDKPAQ
ncbi:MAG: PAS domain S-box protein [bacterium]|nr:PAS domain S-box protein [bacterium]